MKNKYDTLEWVKKVIRGCKTVDHYMGARATVRNYKKLYGELLNNEIYGVLNVELHNIKKKVY